VLCIRANGYRNLFEGRWYTQLDSGEHTYWTMGAPVDETILIDRKRIAPDGASQPGAPGHTPAAT
jgi:hypothetical protein